MLRRDVAAAIICICIFTRGLSAQTAKVDFRRDVQPLFKENCIDCHGPSQQMNGFRLDRRNDAMRGGTFVMIIPESSSRSLLYLRLTGSSVGLLSTQLEDGSWYVKSRAIKIQPFFESGFPHGHDQWISVAASNWAIMALAGAAR